MTSSRINVAETRVIRVLKVAMSAADPIQQQKVIVIRALRVLSQIRMSNSPMYENFDNTIPVCRNAGFCPNVICRIDIIEARQGDL